MQKLKINVYLTLHSYEKCSYFNVYQPSLEVRAFSECGLTKWKLYEGVLIKFPEGAEKPEEVKYSYFFMKKGVHNAILNSIAPPWSLPFSCDRPDALRLPMLRLRLLLQILIFCLSCLHRITLAIRS